MVLGVMTIYPLKFKPFYLEKVWGGDRLRTALGRKIPLKKIGESWEVSTHSKGMSIVRNGDFTGMSLQQLVGLYKEELLGKKFSNETSFPLLIKIIDAAEALSVQVHPDDDFAAKVEGHSGKSEAWYVLEAGEDAKIIYGLQPGVDKSQLAEALENNTIMNKLRHVPVRAGDLIYVPAGTVHAISGGVMVYEIQQTSDITYRLYDYERKEKGMLRELQVEKALACLKASKQPDTDFRRSSLITPFFRIERYNVHGQLPCSTQGAYVLLCVMEGVGEIAWCKGHEPIGKGDTVLVPACLGDFVVTGSVSGLMIRPRGNHA